MLLKLKRAYQHRKGMVIVVVNANVLLTGVQELSTSAGLFGAFLVLGLALST
jgi:hypothetical protein